MTNKNLLYKEINKIQKKIKDLRTFEHTFETPNWTSAPCSILGNHKGTGNFK